MDLYTSVSYRLSKQLTLRYSSSFGMSSRLFSSAIQPHIFAIYGLVRIADEIVDTYRGTDARAILDQLETDTYAAIQSGYSANPIIHSFALTAQTFAISDDLIAPFFTSMRMDIPPSTYTPDDYQSYIYGSAEVVGLMCLRVFCGGNQAQYDTLRPGASALGAAYQKVNFLRDLAADYTELGRVYFPGVTFNTFNDAAKQLIIDDIRADFNAADSAINALPPSSRVAVRVSYRYYIQLLRRLERTPAENIKSVRIRIATPHKLWLLVQTLFSEKVRS
ncbi:phytoene/squalene synthase family protein [bacterium]|nr:MAG: phytoene/squalene synthase family protein [bacterium]